MIWPPFAQSLPSVRLLAVLAWVAAPTPSAAAPPPERFETSHLPNAVRVHGRVISGGLPEGDAGFAELAALGVKTVVSVDGQKPDVAAAARHGLRYVHLPHGYDGVPDSRARELAGAVRELPGPIYIHCHHGKHRSPAAAGVACVAAGLLTPERALEALDAAGTGHEYRGLYASVRAARPLDDTELAAQALDFPEVAQTPPLVDAMVAIEGLHDSLRRHAADGWPGDDAAHDALLLRETFAELLRDPPTSAAHTGWREALARSVRCAESLEAALRGADSPGEPRARDTATRRLDAVSADCKACHRVFRDAPASGTNATSDAPAN